MEHVQIRQTGFHHHHVGALGDVESDLAQGLIAIGGIHLVAPLIGLAERRFGPEGLAERSIKGRRIFRGVGKYAHVAVPRFIEAIADAPDPAIHHVGRCDDVDAGGGLGEGLPAQDVDRFVIQNPAID